MSGIWAGLSCVILRFHVAFTGVTQWYSAGLVWKVQDDFTHVAAPQQEQGKAELRRDPFPSLYSLRASTCILPGTVVGLLTWYSGLQETKVDMASLLKR